jgi:hypothetical protein
VVNAIAKFSSPSLSAGQRKRLEDSALFGSESLVSRLRLLYPVEQRSMYAMDRILREPQRLSERCDLAGCLIVRRDKFTFPIYLSMALQPLWTVASFQFLNPYTVGRTPWTGDEPAARPLPTQNKYT